MPAAARSIRGDPGLQPGEPPGDAGSRSGSRGTGRRPRARWRDPVTRNGKAQTSAAPSSSPSRNGRPRAAPRTTAACARSPPSTPPITPASGDGCARSSSMALGPTFQTRSNQARKMSVCARADRSAGHSAGRGARSSRRRDDGHRVGDHLAVLQRQDRDERLPAQRDDRGAVVRVDVDPVDLQALVPRGERDAVDVRRVRDPQTRRSGSRQRSS